MNFNFGLSKTLGEDGNEQRLEKALEIMEFLSSEEGQKELAVLETDVSPLGKKAPPAENTPYADVWKLVESGDCLPYLYYWSGIDAVIENGSIVSAVLPDGTAVKKDESYRVMICTGDYDTAAYPGGEDTGIVVSDAYCAVMEGKTIAVPGKLCR